MGFFLRIFFVVARVQDDVNRSTKSEPLWFTTSLSVCYSLRYPLIIGTVFLVGPGYETWPLVTVPVVFRMVDSFFCSSAC